MTDPLPSSEQLAQELATLRARLAELEHVQAEYEQVITRLNQFFAAIEQSANSIVITDVAGNIEYVNPQFCQLTGYSLEEALGQNPRILKSGLTPEDTYPALWDTLLAGQAWVGEFVNKKKNGEHYWERAAIAPIKNEAGEITHFVAAKEDITARKTAEQSLATRNNALRALHETALDIGLEHEMPALLQRIMDRAVTLLDADRGGGIYLYDAAADALCLSAASGINEGRVGYLLPLGKGVSGRVYQSGLPLIINDYVQWGGKATVLVNDPPSAVLGVPLRVQDRVLGVLAIFADSQRRIFSEHDVYLAEMLAGYAAMAIQNARGYELLQQEIAERKHVEQVARENEARYRLLAENVADVIWVLDANMQVAYVSPSVRQLRGYTPDEVMAQPLAEVLSPESLAVVEAGFRDMMQHVAAGQRYTPRNRHELEQPRKDGSTVWTEVTTSVLYDAHDDFIGFLGVSRDITERRRAEQERLVAAVERERANLIARFIQDAAHEFRNPLAVISTRLYLWRKHPTSKAAEESVETIKREVAYLSALVEAMLDMARLDGGVDFAARPQAVSSLLHRLADQFAPQAAAKQIAFTCQESPESAVVVCDPVYLHQALANLIDNALRYTPPGGRVTVRAALASGQVQIAITDTGSGISEAQLPEIFGRFFRVDAARTDRGVGLGLPIAQRIIDGHGGAITVESAPGQGSTFTVTLPLGDRPVGDRSGNEPQG